MEHTKIDSPGRQLYKTVTRQVQISLYSLQRQGLFHITDYIHNFWCKCTEVMDEKGLPGMGLSTITGSKLSRISLKVI